MINRRNQLEYQLKDLQNLPHSFKTRIHLPVFRKKDTTIKQKTDNLVKFRKHLFFDSQDIYIKNILIQDGWIIRRNVLDCNFVWVYNLHKIPYQPKSHQLVNHFKDTWALTTKEGLRNTLYKNSSSEMKVSNFYPRTYNLQNQFLEFKNDFLLTSILVVLKKLIVFFEALGIKNVNCQNVDFNRFMKLQDKFQNQNESIFLVPKHLLLYQILLLEKYYRLQQGIMYQSEMPLFQVSESNIKLLFQFSKKDFPYLNFYSKSALATPSRFTINILFMFHIYYKHKFPHYQSDGFNNIWIIKHSQGSKGQGIELIDDLQNIPGSIFSLKVIQKYIQNIWIFTEQELQQYSQVPRGLQRLINRKFDIRLWVLIKSAEPLVVYMFEQGVIRISSQVYTLNRIKNLHTHLTNYSINKQNFIDQEQSYLKLSTFLTHLKWKYNYTSLLQKMKQIIIKTLQSSEISPCKQSFELLGFDMMLDSNLNPWLLEVNMSPACKSRGELSQIKDQMAKGMLQILGIIDSNNYQNKKSRKWVKIIEAKNIKIPSILEKIQINGRYINKVEIDLVQSKIKKHQSALKIQKTVRQKILYNYKNNLARQNKVESRVKILISLLSDLLKVRKKESFSQILTRSLKTQVSKISSKTGNYRSRLISKMVRKQK